MEIQKAALQEDNNGLLACELWFKSSDIATIIDKNKMIEETIKIELLDMPGVYHY